MTTEYIAILSYASARDRYMVVTSLDEVKTFAKRTTVRRIVQENHPYPGPGRSFTQAEWCWDSSQGRP